MSESTCVSKGPCSECGSSDGNALYDDGHSFCFVCNHHTHQQGVHVERKSRISADMIPPGEIVSLPVRKISEETCQKFGYSVSTFNNKPVQVAQYHNDKGEICGQKLRFANKDFLFVGNPKDAVLFGQNLWRDAGKKVVITEGEIDAMSLSQLQQNKWPVVSVQNGAAGAVKSVKKSLQWLEGFEEVVFMFDSDKPGQDAARACAELLTPGKAKIATLPMKDANEMLVAGRGKELISAMWDAKTFRPDGIVAGVDLWERIKLRKKFDATAYPWAGLNNVLGGCRRSELVTVTAGSGVGKSAIVREIAYHFHRTGESIGYVALEESTERTGLLFMGLELKKRIHLDDSGVDEETLRAAYTATVGSGRMFLYDHFGSLDAENLISRIRYLVRGCGCGTVVLDHISIAISGIEDGDERRMIDNLMTRLRSLVQELDFRLIVISHLKRPQGKGHEEGAMTSLSQLRGSHSIAQISDVVIGLERDQQSDNKEYTLVRVLKNRWSGETGEACWLKYDRDTGRLDETTAPVDLDEEAPQHEESTTGTGAF